MNAAHRIQHDDDGISAAKETSFDGAEDGDVRWDRSGVASTVSVASGNDVKKARCDSSIAFSPDAPSHTSGFRRALRRMVVGERLRIALIPRLGVPFDDGLQLVSGH